MGVTWNTPSPQVLESRDIENSNFRFLSVADTDTRTLLWSEEATTREGVRGGEVSRSELVLKGRGGGVKVFSLGLVPKDSRFLEVSFLIGSLGRQNFEKESE